MRLLTSTRIESYLRNRYKNLVTEREDCRNLNCTINCIKYRISITDTNLIKIGRYSNEYYNDTYSSTDMKVVTQVSICVNFSQIISEVEKHSLN